MKNYIPIFSKWLSMYVLFLIGIVSTVQAQSGIQVQFEVDMSSVNSQVKEHGMVGLRGSQAPLSWDHTYELTDVEGDGIFTGTITFPSSDKPLEYKYVYGNVFWELTHEGNRRLSPSTQQPQIQKDIWNYTFIASPHQIDTYKIPAAQLQEEAQIMRKAYTQLHPGLYRYTDSLTMEGYFDGLQRYFQQDRTLKETYKAYSQVLAHIRCGHTYTNFWNQPTAIKQSLITNNDKVPFTFHIDDGRIFIERNASEEERLTAGTEILSINGISTQTVIDSLLTVVKGDGYRNEKRLETLQVNGVDKYEAFDVYYPLFFDLPGNEFQLVCKPPHSSPSFTTKVAAVTPAQRKDQLTLRYPDRVSQPEELWKFQILNEKTGYMKLGTFTMWNLKLNWKKFLKDAFAEMKQKNVPNLILDIRGNEGGLDEVILELGKYLINRPTTIQEYKTRLGYQTIPSDLRPYLDTWDKNFMDLGKRVIPAEGGLYQWKNEDNTPKTYPPTRQAYQGKTYLLINAGNSSATFYLSKLAKENQLATLVGQQTGGNLRGINGGILFFLRMPHSQVEMDLPVMATFPHSPQPDEGIRPDVEVSFNPEDLANGIDTEMKAVLQLITKKSP